MKIFGIDVNVKVWQCATVISINHGKIIELDLSKDWRPYYLGTRLWIAMVICPMRSPKKSWTNFWVAEVKKVRDSFHFFQRIIPIAKTWRRKNIKLWINFWFFFKFNNYGIFLENIEKKWFFIDKTRKCEVEIILEREKVILLVENRRKKK